MANVEYNILVDFNTGFQLGKADLTDSVATGLGVPNLVAELPAKLVAGQGLTLTYYLYDNLTENVKTDCSGLTPTLSGRLLGSAQARVTLDTGTVGGAGNNEISFTVQEGDIPEGWASALNQNVRILLECSDSADNVQAYQDVSVISIEQFDTAVVSSEDFSIDLITINGVSTEPGALPGIRNVILNGSSASAQLTLPTTPGYDGQTFKIYCEDSTNTCTVSGNGNTINGESSFTMDASEFAEVFEYNGDWVLLNPSVGIN